MATRLGRLQQESKTLPAQLGPRTSAWILALFGIALLPSGLFALAFFYALTNTSAQSSGWGWNLGLNWVFELAGLSWFLTNLLAFVALIIRRDWGLGLGYIACIFMGMTVVGLLPAALIAFFLHRRWEHNQTGVAAEAPRWVESVFGFTTFGLLAGWIVFLVFVDQAARAGFEQAKLRASDADPIVGLAFYMGAALFVLQGAALLGLVRRKVWGREAATLAAIVLACTVVGIPLAYLILRALWSQQPQPAVPAGAPA